MYKLSPAAVIAYKLIAIRDASMSLGRFMGDVKGGRPKSLLFAFARQAHSCAVDYKSLDPNSMRLRLSRLRSEFEMQVCPAVAPDWQSRHLEEAMTLLGMVRNVESYATTGDRLRP